MKSNMFELIQAEAEVGCGWQRHRCDRASPDAARRRLNAKTGAWPRTMSATQTNLEWTQAHRSYWASERDCWCSKTWGIVCPSMRGEMRNKNKFEVDHTRSSCFAKAWWFRHGGFQTGALWACEQSWPNSAKSCCDRHNCWPKEGIPHQSRSDRCDMDHALQEKVTRHKSHVISHTPHATRPMDVSDVTRKLHQKFEALKLSWASCRRVIDKALCVWHE